MVDTSATFTGSIPEYYDRCFGPAYLSLDDVIEKVTAALTRIGGADPYRGVAKSIVVEARRR